MTAALALIAGAAGAQAMPAPQTQAEEVHTGKRLYVSYCTRCHGVNMVSPGGAFFDLRTFPREDKERFLRSMKEGKRAKAVASKLTSKPASGGTPASSKPAG